MNFRRHEAWSSVLEHYSCFCSLNKLLFPPQTASRTNFTPLLSSGAFASWNPHSLQEEASPEQELTASWQFPTGMLPFICRGNCSRPPIWARNTWQRCYILQIFWCFKSNIGPLNKQNLSFKISLLLYIFCLLMEPTSHRTGWEQNSVFAAGPWVYLPSGEAMGSELKACIFMQHQYPILFQPLDITKQMNNLKPTKEKNK